MSPASALQQAMADGALSLAEVHSLARIGEREFQATIHHAERHGRYPGSLRLESLLCSLAAFSLAVQRFVATE